MAKQTEKVWTQKEKEAKRLALQNAQEALHALSLEVADIDAQEAGDELEAVMKQIETFGKFWTLAERRQICRALEIEIVADVKSTTSTSTPKATKKAGDGKPKKYKLPDDAGEGLAGAEWSGIGMTKKEFRDWDNTQQGKDWHKHNKGENGKKTYPLNPTGGAEATA